MQNHENENLTIYENTNGQIMVKDLSQVQIKNINELYEFIASGVRITDYEMRSRVARDPIRLEAGDSPAPLALFQIRQTECKCESE